MKRQFNQRQLKPRYKYYLSGKDITFRTKTRGILLRAINPRGNKIILDTLLKHLQIILDTLLKHLQIILDTLLKHLQIITIRRNFFPLEPGGLAAVCHGAGDVLN